ncbi:BlaR1 family beta-lactam sensor/signal transducer [Anaerosinus massiliensis]|uniref:BlaR1 family beta-lactam sensor/signal transducer n=1 Tax=Massilibacillus massiliensis TaxID=1806837 RepID=UPI000B2F1AF7|nr:BlaR1 family beta-lactam sensor/signal transducer [Massilibacillus massiliensis]
MILHSFIFWLLYSSLMGSLLTGIILLVRAIFKHKMDANGHYLLWFLLIVKLFLPFAPESPISVFNIFNQVTFQNFTGNYFEGQTNEKAIQKLNKRSHISQMGEVDDYFISVNRPFLSGDKVLFLAWLMGVVSLTAYTFHLTRKQKWIIKNSLKVADREVLHLLEECKQTINTKAVPVLVESPLIRSPIVAGAARSYIIFPTGSIGRLSQAEVRFILLHELAHLRRRDLYMNWMIALFQIMHWFNPIIWYAFYKMRQDRELACDAYVLSVLNPKEYKSYGAAIISFFEMNVRSSYGSITGFASGKVHLKERIKRIAMYEKRTVGKRIGESILLLLMGCFLLTNATGASGVIQVEKSSKPNHDIIYEDLSAHFKGFEGSFVLFDVEKNHYQIYNETNSQKRVSPDSTYKIMSALIGLETGVLADENAELSWDKTVYPIEPWNKDHNLASAMAYSVNWYFQKVDAMVGEDRVENYLQQADYGNYDISGGMRDFWIESSLKISPLEQVDLLKKLYAYDLPFSRRNIDIVKKLIKISAQDDVILYGKTGTGNVNGDTRNGWFVGYVERNGRVYIFATNIQGQERADGANAKTITLDVLKEKKII